MTSRITITTSKGVEDTKACTPRNWTGTKETAYQLAEKREVVVIYVDDLSVTAGESIGVQIRPGTFRVTPKDIHE